MRRQAELRARFTAPNRWFRTGGPGLTTTMINDGVYRCWRGSIPPSDIGRTPLDTLRREFRGSREISTKTFELRTQMFEERLLANIVIRVELSD
jgi:hypothetical protein